MTRAELIARVGHRFPHLTREDTELSVKAILNALTDTLAAGNRAEIRSFGSFSVNVRPARMARNPKTGVSVAVPPKPSPHFKPGAQMKDAINLSIITNQNRLAA